MNPILLTPLDISVAASLIILDAVLSIWLGLRLHRQIAIAAARMVVQLVAIGYVLRFIFSLNNPAATLLLILIMVLVAAREVAAIQTSSSDLSVSALPPSSRRSLH
jgi:putative ABC transport system permease protein